MYIRYMKIFLANSPSENSSRPPEKRNLDESLLSRQSGGVGLNFHPQYFNTPFSSCFTKSELVNAV
jgi:hypothetical protein